VLAVILAVASIGVQEARSQPAAGSASGSDTAPAVQAEDEEASAGSSATLVAPADPKARLVWLQTKVAQALSSFPQLGKARIGAYALDLASDTELFSHAADTGLAIASSTKLLTSIAALGTLGGGFRWRTAVYADDIDDATGKVTGNLYLRGRGDPTLSKADLDQLAADVAARGIRSIDGQLIVDTGYFDTDVEPPHFADQPKERAGFRAPVASLGVGKSAFTVTVLPDPSGPGIVQLDPDVPDYVRTGKIDVKTVTDKRTRLKIDVKPKGGRLEVDVSGQIKVATGSYDVRKRIDDPVKLATEVFRAALAAHDVKLGKRSVAIGPVPTTAKLVAAHDSAPLALVIREMNKQSDNYVAESLLKTLGAETRATPGPATWADGKAGVAAFLAKLGIPAGTYRADNGSGLYDASSVSPHQLVTLLRAAYRDFRIGPDLVASLPTGGVDGTLAKRWTKSAAKGRVRAKTGTLDKVVSLAGYVATDDSHQLAFAIVANDIPPGQRAAARALADAIVDALLAYVDAAGSSPR
jgi:D-alanyl-D-alanine carboxypeptidase/D-alanyl-D-alanine-endopeptidase (penicillin-binding protein 4)